MNLHVVVVVVVCLFVCLFVVQANKGDGGLNYTPADLVKTMTEMTGPLCEQMEKTCAFFQVSCNLGDVLRWVETPNFSL